MRIAVVTPFVARVFGNRVAFAIARELATAHEVMVMAHTVDHDIVGAVRSLVAPARFVALREERIPALSMGRLLWWQLARGPDRTLAAALEREHRTAAFDAVLVVADEGHWLGAYLRRWPAPRPVSALCVLELLDHVFLLGDERPWAGARRLAAPAYPWVHGLEARRLASFDQLTAISRWTAELLDYLYGQPIRTSLAAYDDRLFVPPPAGGSAASPYIAVPTAALDRDGEELVRRLHQKGVPLRTFGPRPVPGVPHGGFVSDAQLVRLLTDARATLFLFDYEALGLLPIESLAVGTPVVTWPRQGPWSEHRSNPNVHFGASFAEVETLVEELATTPKTDASVRECVHSVAAYRPRAVVERLIPLLQRGPHAGRSV